MGFALSPYSGSNPITPTKASVVHGRNGSTAFAGMTWVFQSRAHSARIQVDLKCRTSTLDQRYDLRNRVVGTVPDLLLHAQRSGRLRRGRVEITFNTSDRRRSRSANPGTACCFYAPQTLFSSIGGAPAPSIRACREYRSPAGRRKNSCRHSQQSSRHVPEKTEIRFSIGSSLETWIPAFAGMTVACSPGQIARPVLEGSGRNHDAV